MPFLTTSSREIEPIATRQSRSNRRSGLGSGLVAAGHPSSGSQLGVYMIPPGNRRKMAPVFTEVTPPNGREMLLFRHGTIPLPYLPSETGALALGGIIATLLTRPSWANKANSLLEHPDPSAVACPWLRCLLVIKDTVWMVLTCNHATLREMQSDPRRIRRTYAKHGCMLCGCSLQRCFQKFHCVASLTRPRHP